MPIAVFDLDAYLTRIGATPERRADAAALARLHRAHAGSIPFENLDIQMGQAIALDPASLQTALVTRRRGGYCFQQNGLFRLALHAMGFDVRARTARVFDPSGIILPRTHMVLAVSVSGHDWLADVGFGGLGIVEPLPLSATAVGDGAAAEQDGWRYRLTARGPLHVLQRARLDDGWDDLYAFDDEDAVDADLVMGNWYTSTHPGSKFVRTLTAQRIDGRSRHLLRNLTYGVARADAALDTRPVTRDGLVPLLRDVFGLDVPAGARFRALDREPPASTASL